VVCLPFPYDHSNIVDESQRQIVLKFCISATSIVWLEQTCTELLHLEADLTCELSIPTHGHCGIFGAHAYKRIAEVWKQKKDDIKLQSADSMQQLVDMTNTKGNS